MRRKARSFSACSIGACERISSGIMRRGALGWQLTAWSAVAIMVLALGWQERAMPGKPTSYHAIRIVRVTINSDQRDAYVAQVKTFAAASRFTVRFSQTTPYPNDIAAHMERGDLWASALSVSL